MHSHSPDIGSIARMSTWLSATQIKLVIHYLKKYFALFTNDFVFIDICTPQARILPTPLPMPDA
jgi:hypothetical protein